MRSIQCRSRFPRSPAGHTVAPGATFPPGAGPGHGPRALHHQMLPLQKRDDRGLDACLLHGLHPIHMLLNQGEGELSGLATAMPSAMVGLGGRPPVARGDGSGDAGAWRAGRLRPPPRDSRLHRHRHPRQEPSSPRGHDHRLRIGELLTISSPRPLAAMTWGRRSRDEGPAPSRPRPWPRPRLRHSCRLAG